MLLIAFAGDDFSYYDMYEAPNLYDIKEPGYSFYRAAIGLVAQSKSIYFIKVTRKRVYFWSISNLVPGGGYTRYVSAVSLLQTQ